MGTDSDVGATLVGVASLIEADMSVLQEQRPGSSITLRADVVYVLILVQPILNRIKEFIVFHLVKKLGVLWCKALVIIRLLPWIYNFDL